VQALFHARRISLLAIFLACFAAGEIRTSAYSVLAHEAIVDMAWQRQIVPLLLKRYPRTTPIELAAARGYAYGGCVIQDLGYYPFGSRFFSNLLHYVRSGDFIEALLLEAQSVDEYAFALGALAHYASDNTGHPQAINRAVPLIFPKLRREYGDRVTYQQAPHQHVLVEFSLDVVQTAAGRYGPEAYARLLGFAVARPVLERAFLATYGLPLDGLFPDVDLAIGTYRFSVSQMIPAITAAAWHDERNRIARLIPNVQEREFVFRFSRAQYESRYGTRYQKPSWFARFLAGFFRIVPKIGPLKSLLFETPTPEAYTLFTSSLREANARFSAELINIDRRRLSLTNTDYDTGRPTRYGEYQLADDTYAELVKRLAKRHAADLPGKIRLDLRAFYRGVRPPKERKEARQWRDVQANLLALEIGTR
jgi:hypothetical protein